jgi:hypothetical protein
MTELKDAAGGDDAIDAGGVGKTLLSSEIRL